MVKNFRVNVNSDNIQEVTVLLTTQGINITSKPTNLDSGEAQIRITGTTFGYANKPFYDKNPPYSSYIEFSMPELYKNFGMLKIKMNRSTRGVSADRAEYKLNNVNVKVNVASNKVEIVLFGGNEYVTFNAAVTRFAFSLANGFSGNIKINNNDLAIKTFLELTNCI